MDSEIQNSSGLSLEAANIGKSLSLNDQAAGRETISILDDINLSVKAGESCAIVGASGSGKTTLLGILAAMDPPDQGDVVLSGSEGEYSVYHHDEDWRASLRGQEMGFVFQNFQLIADMTALDNVMLPLELAGVDGQSIAASWLAKVGLSERMDHYPRQLSGGEQQRVALARAFANSPRLLFADEPTGSLDETTAASMIELLFELNRSSGSTMVMVTHDPVLAARCDSVYQLSNGTLNNITGQTSSSAASAKAKRKPRNKPVQEDLSDLPEQQKLI